MILTKLPPLKVHPVPLKQGSLYIELFLNKNKCTDIFLFLCENIHSEKKTLKLKILFYQQKKKKKHITENMLKNVW